MNEINPIEAGGLGDAALEPTDLFNKLYAELLRMSRRELRRNGARDMVSTGTLVHEAWMVMDGRPELSFEAPGQFLAYASRTMRGLVVDRVRARHAQKRGGGVTITSLDTRHAEEVAEPESLQGLADALEALATIEPELAQVVDLKFFCGFTLGEIAVMQGLGERTVQRRWEKARMLLHSAIS